MACPRVLSFALCPPTPKLRRHQPYARLRPWSVQQERSSQTSSSLAALLGMDTVSNSDLLTSPEAIKQAFSLATFLPQPFWGFLILAPNAKITRQILGDYKVPILLSLVHLFIVSDSILQPGGTAPITEFSGVFDPAGAPQQSMMGMMRYPSFVSEEWSHVLTWDLFVGRWIWLDGLERGVFTPHSTLLCNLIGPPGLLLHVFTSLVTGKGLPEGTQSEGGED
eukprot:CAMPEP_0194034822 /NCGR_PEP_ID=MMETSP0009_2-20130614/7255_1 /TAXON_ID=210454 /ORGANISM="Grammatophora oceanica, Strain CCMP 410" /LENGTH=222 /DNA_ID=CAMNT_0038675907 /DNA_START=48 /DNA_END=716 /DNA_ORIENTATION=+